MLACVVCVCASGLVAWRWWLAHALAVSQTVRAERDTLLASIEPRMKELENKLRELQYSQARK